MDTYEKFRERWSDLVGDEYRTATAKTPTIDGKQTTYVHLNRATKPTYNHLCYNLENGDEHGRWIAAVQLLLVSAEYIQRSVQ